MTSTSLLLPAQTCSQYDRDFNDRIFAYRIDVTHFRNEDLTRLADRMIPAPGIGQIESQYWYAELIGDVHGHAVIADHEAIWPIK